MSEDGQRTLSPTEKLVMASVLFPFADILAGFIVLEISPWIFLRLFHVVVFLMPIVALGTVAFLQLRGAEFRPGAVLFYFCSVIATACMNAWAVMSAWASV